NISIAAVTDAEMEANFLVDDQGSGAIRAPGGTIVNGEVYTVGGRSGGGWQLIRSSGGSWVTNNISFDSAVYDALLSGQVMQNNSVLLKHITGTTFDLYLFGDSGGFSHLKRFRTTDLINFALQEVLTTGSFHHWQLQYSANFIETSNNIVFCCKATHANYSDLFIKRI
ncbi:MAG: hypothetical protein ACXAAH_12490, partial [Promethearchaeota archaeon]